MVSKYSTIYVFLNFSEPFCFFAHYIYESGKRREKMTDAERITNEYMEKIFYYSLRKTGSREDAEELVQDIMLELFTSLSRGYVIENEPAWVWAVVRNRYARWAAQKRVGRESDGGELCDDTADDGDGPEEVLVRNEETELLYRELRLLSKG